MTNTVPWHHAGARTHSQGTTLAAPDPVRRLPDALDILTARMREAMVERRAGPPGGDRYRRADERVAYLNELYGLLQRRMEVPAEIWLLDGDRASVSGRRSHRGNRR